MGKAENWQNFIQAPNIFEDMFISNNERSFIEFVFCIFNTQKKSGKGKEKKLRRKEVCFLIAFDLTPRKTLNKFKILSRQ